MTRWRPARRPMDEWEPQPDGSMRNKKTGISVTVMNPCPPGDIEHEFALAAVQPVALPPLIVEQIPPIRG